MKIPKRYYYFLVIYAFITVCFYPQQKDTLITTDKFEELLEDATSENEESQIYDLIEELLHNPIYLNTASVNDLLRIPLLDIQSARAIIHRRNLLGGIYKPEDLQNIVGAEREIIDRILPFLKLGDKSEGSFFDSFTDQFSNLKLNFRSRIMEDLQLRNGFSTGKFEGSRLKFYNRLKINAGEKVYAGILFEKDAGEKSISDFSSFHMKVKDIFIFNTVILGNYIFEFGQGLAIWSPYSFSKGTNAVNILSKGASNAATYTSADENQFFRGATFKLGIGPFLIAPFFSSNQKDASIDSLSGRITSLSLDGLHRTKLELSKENSINEFVFGTSIDFNSIPGTKLGILYYQTKYSSPFEMDNPLKSAGNRFEFLSGSHSVFLNDLYLCGEVAYNMSSIASIHNLIFSPDRNLSLLFSFRNFPHNYINLHASSFGEKGTAQNEVGFYTGIRLRTEYGTFNIYYDQFKFPIASSSYSFSSTGNDFLFYYTNKIFRNTEIRLKYKNETKEIIEIIDDETGLVKRSQQNYRAELNFVPSDFIQMRTRFELVHLTKTTQQPMEKGFLLFQELKYEPFNKLIIYGRIIFFSTDSYDSRIYEFENDLTGVMTNPALYGEGIRWYLMVRYTVTMGMNLSLKYSELYKPNERYLGSGYSEISGNLDNRISFQVDFSF